MGWYTLIQIILQFVTHLFLPGYLLYDLWKQPGPSRFKWLAQVIHHSSYVFYIFLAGRWDMPPPERDVEHLAGNYVVIACQNVSVLMAHMQKGSLTVRAGDTVTTEHVVGRVGNSGNTTERHLHIHAVRGSAGNMFEGEGVPMFFEEKFPARNTLFVR